MQYRFCGKSGLQLPLISLGLWHNFGDTDNYATMLHTAMTAFENGVTHFDLANNYGPAPGAAETNFGRILRDGLGKHRDQIIVTSKAGHTMWDGPYGDGGSRKYLMASIDQSLRRTGLEYFDIFYSHRYCPETPLEETVQALIDIVRAGKALYVGLSKYPADKALEASRMMQEQHVRCLVYQDRYNLLDRSLEHPLPTLPPTPSTPTPSPSSPSIQSATVFPDVAPEEPAPAPNPASPSRTRVVRRKPNSPASSHSLQSATVFPGVAPEEPAPAPNYLDFLQTQGLGLVIFSPLAQGLLTNRYLHGIPADSRVAKSGVFLKESDLTPDLLQKLHSLNEIAESRGQTLAQMSLAWLLRDPFVTSVIVGASSPAQLLDSIAATANLHFTSEQLAAIDHILTP